MTYELALKLKDSGFRYGNQLHRAYKPDGTFVTMGDEISSIDVWEPTLSELIEACGEKFKYLEFIIDGGIDGNEKLWWAVSRRSLVPEEYQRAGETREEAVANLWLALNTQ